MAKENRNQGLSRRELVKGMGVLVGATAAMTLTGCAETDADSPQKEFEWDASADVVIVGAGAAGDMAALECSRSSGLKVLLLESLDHPFGSSHVSGGEVVLCETEMSPGSRDDLFKDLVAAAQNDCQEDVVRSYVDAAPDVYNILTDLGVTFHKTKQVAYMSQEWDHVSEGDSGAHIMGVLEKQIAEDPNIELLTGVRGRKLVVDENGSVIGVEAETKRGVVKYGASKGVIITAGSFTRNPVMAKALGRRGSDFIVPLTGLGCLGDGLTMGLNAGADISYLGAGVKPSAPVGNESHVITIAWQTCGSIIVGLNGKRFYSEGDNYVLISEAAMDLPGALFFQVYDAPMRKALEDYTGSYIFGLPDETDEITGDTLESLASAIATKYPDFDTVELLKTVATYNGYVETGNDLDFGRTNISGIAGDLVTIKEGPFYAIACVPGTTHFNGGLKTDAGMRVISAFDDGAPIDGLYAAGEVTGGFHGYGYMSGTAFGKALIFGVVAARSLASDIS